MTGAAEIRVTGRGEMFVAHDCSIDNGWLHASGRWRARLGANGSELRWSDVRTYSWPADAVREVRWQENPA